MRDVNGIQLWLLSWFRDRIPALISRSDDEIVQMDFFTEELIDSLGVVDLISDAEGALGFRFSEVDFQDRRFSTIVGLSEIINVRLNGKV